MARPSRPWPRSRTSTAIGAAPARAPALLVDLNHATLAELKALPEIGHAYAERIVRGRPYDSKRQLASRGIIPEGVYEKVAPMIIARQAP